MAMIYGDRWTAQWGTVPKGNAARIWVEVLRPMTGRQIRIGMRCALRDPSRFPPSPGQFTQWVQENDSPAHRVIPQTRRIGRMAARDEVVEENLAAMKELVR